MTDWKGTKVEILIYENGDWTEEVYSEVVHLDTDTMNNLFIRFPPATHEYKIEPWPSEEAHDFVVEWDMIVPTGDDNVFLH